MVPAPPVTGVNDVAAWFCVRLVKATACVAVTAAFTFKLKVFVAVALFVSVTVTVKLMAETVAAVVPVTAPVVELMLSPAGSKALAQPPNPQAW